MCKWYYRSCDFNSLQTRAKRFLCESSLCSTVDLTQEYFVDHHETIYFLKRTGILNLWQMSLKLSDRSSASRSRNPWRSQPAQYSYARLTKLAKVMMTFRIWLFLILTMLSDTPIFGDVNLTITTFQCSNDNTYNSLNINSLHTKEETWQI